MLKSLFSLAVVVNVLILVSSETYEEYGEEKSASASSAQGSSSSSITSDDTSTTSTSSSSSSAQSSASSSANTYSKRKACCKTNERWVECPDALCVPFTCKQVGQPIPCPRIIPGRCPSKPACVCIEGYVKNRNGVCIPKKACPSCRGDSNAQAGCGFLCGKRCDGKAVPKPCPCELNGCQCRKGFAYDSNQGKCVRTENCKNLCPKPNEVWDPCLLGCPPRKCGINDAAVSCLANLPCLRAGCRCQDGYYRNDYGDCVLFEDCPADTSIQGPGTETPSSCSDQVEKLFIQGSAAWNGKMLFESYILTPSTSLIMSPFSVFVPMGELLAFSQGRTKDQFLNVFNLSSKDDLKCIFPSIIDKIKAVQNVILNLANRIFITDEFPLTKNFLDTTSEMFDAVAESLDFSNAEASAKRINEWAADSTNNRIKEIASPDMITLDTRLILANAIYFLGNWTYQFNEDNTNDRDFYVNKDTIVKIPTMFQQNTFKYVDSEKLNSQLLSLPYKGNEVEFLIILPNEIEGLSTVIDAAQNPDVFYEAYNNMTFEKARVYLPKIKTETELNLADLMQKAGITDVFNPAASNLTGILETYEPLHISAAKQKAFCLVNEKGTEAAAVNVITVGTTSVQIPPPKIIDFDCNRPFAFYIMYSNIQLFSGTFVKQNEDSAE